MNDLDKARAKEAEVRLMEAVHAALFAPYVGYFWSRGREAVETFDAVFRALGQTYIEVKNSLPEPARSKFSKIIAARLEAPICAMDAHRQRQLELYTQATSQARIENLEREALLLPSVARRNALAIKREREAMHE